MEHLFESTRLKIMLTALACIVAGDWPIHPEGREATHTHTAHRTPHNKWCRFCLCTCTGSFGVSLTGSRSCVYRFNHMYAGKFPKSLSANCGGELHLDIQTNTTIIINNNNENESVPTT